MDNLITIQRNTGMTADHDFYHKYMIFLSKIAPDFYNYRQEKIEEAIKNGQSRDTEHKKNKTKNTIHKIKQVTNTDPINKTGGERRRPRRVSSSGF